MYVMGLVNSPIIVRSSLNEESAVPYHSGFNLLEHIHPRQHRQKRPFNHFPVRKHNFHLCLTVFHVSENLHLTSTPFVSSVRVKSECEYRKWIGGTPLTDESWENLFARFENQYVLVNIESDAVTILNLVVFLTHVTLDSHHLTLETRGAGRIRFASIYEPYLDENDRLVCVNEDGESITLEKTPVQPV
jgi:hypothetical protein